MATKAAAKSFLEVISNRRSVYALSNKQILPNAQLIQLIQSAVREAPSPFNVQSSRVVVLLGRVHENYWNEIVPQALLKVAGQDAVEKSSPKLKAFASGYGTALFFEDSKLIEGQQQAFPTYAANFPLWSNQSNGMAQVYTWALLEAEGYGCNLQHYGNITADALKEKLNLPGSYDLKAEMVFGFPEAPAGEKTYMPDHERVIAFGP